jgi:hypothetical protein
LESASGKNEWRDKKTRTLEHRKGAAPEGQNLSNTCPPGQNISVAGHGISDTWEGLKLGSNSAGAALFTVFVKGAGFSFMRVNQCAKRQRIGIGQWEK